MFNPFKEDEALRFLSQAAQELDEGNFVLQNVDSSRNFVERNGGSFMIGCLVCTDSLKNTRALLTLSGTTKAIAQKGRNVTEGSYPLTLRSGKTLTFVPPIVSALEIDEALQENDTEIHELTKKIDSLQNGKEKTELKKRRETLTDASLSKVFNLYSFHCADKNMRSLKEICAEQNLRTLPPTGTGECCAIKLLDYAYANSLKPVSMCEALYKKNAPLVVTPPCDSRCKIILPSILGLEILYRDEYIAVINKSSPLLSIPGRGEEKKDSVTFRLKNLFEECIEQPSVHRLDMETSGLMVLAFTKEAHRELSRQFMEGEVSKKYIALLDGVLAKKGIASVGQMELYFRLDVENRPHQIWDELYGKKAVTRWRIIDVERYKKADGSVKNVTRVEFTPLTGRTHQLRLASADSHGFNTPIIGDSLYGECSEGERLMLHACFLEFTHPILKEKMTFTNPAPF